MIIKTKTKYMFYLDPYNCPFRMTDFQSTALSRFAFTDANRVVSIIEKSHSRNQPQMYNCAIIDLRKIRAITPDKETDDIYFL